MSAQFACPQCGSNINPNARFCPECGFPIQAEFYQQARPNQPPPVQPTQRMEDTPDFAPYAPPAEPDFYGETPKPRSRRMLYILGGGLALFACCAVAGVILIFSALSGDGFELSFGSTNTPTPTATATITPTPVATATLQPTATFPLPPTEEFILPTESTGPINTNNLTGSQRLTDTDFFDDFSSAGLNWSEKTSGDSIFGYEGEAYAIQIITPGYIQLVRPPLTDITHLEYNADVAMGGGNGMLGVACYFSDIDNFIYVAFDGESQNLRFAQYVNNEWSQITDWFEHSVPIQGARYGADCTSTQMVAYINNTPVGQIQVSQPDGPYAMWLFVQTWDDTTGGIKVYFDNASGFFAQ